MKKNTVLFCFLILLIFSSCVVHRIENKYICLVEIKKEYGLKNRECRQIVKAARTGEIDVIYHAGRDQWLYPKAYDYGQYKQATK